MTTPLRIGSITQPAALGLSTEDIALATDPRVALELQNTVYDSQGRICARKGWTNVTTGTPGTAVNYWRTTHNLPTSTGEDVITGIPFTPTCCRVRVGVAKTTDTGTGTGVEHAYIGEGYATATAQWAVGSTDRNAESIPNSARFQSDDHVVYYGNVGGPSAQAQGIGGALGPGDGTWTYFWTDAAGDNWFATYEFWDATDCHVGNVTLGTGTVALDCTTTGVNPNVAFVNGVAISAAPNQVSEDDAMYFCGVASNTTGSIVQRGVAWSSLDGGVGNASTLNFKGYDTAVGGKVLGDTDSYNITVSSFDTGKFTVTPSASATGDYIGWLAMNVNEAQTYIGTEELPSATSEWDMNAIGFEAGMVEMFGGLIEAADVNTMQTSGEACEALWFSNSDGLTSGGLAWEALDNDGSVTDTNSLAASGFLWLQNSASVLQYNIPALTLDGGGWTTTPTTADATAHVGFIFAMQTGVSSGLHTDDSEVIHEYVESNTSKRIITAAAGFLYEGTVGMVSVTGALTPAADDWQFANFNGKVLGIQNGEPLIVKTGAGSFATVTAASGTVPSGNTLLSAWGRLWADDNSGKAIKFSALLDETHWLTGAGSVDLTEVWPDGLDHVVALAEWQDRLVIFGQRSILIYINAYDAATTPDSVFQLDDVIRVGCVARDSVAPVANDLLFLDIDGLHSLQRAIEYENTPQEPLALGVRTDISDDIAQVINTPAVIKCGYSNLHGFYLSRIGNRYWCFDVGQGSARASKWTGIGFFDLVGTTDGTLYLAQNSGVGEYTGFADNGSDYQVIYSSAWLDLAEGREIYPKTMKAVVISTGGYTVDSVIRYDYIPADFITTYTLNAGGTSEWQPANVATVANHEWGTAQWSGGASGITTASFDLSGSGARTQIGIRVDINGDGFCLQRIDLTSRIGRIAS